MVPVVRLSCETQTNQKEKNDMKTNISAVILALTLAASFSSGAADAAAQPPASPEFERLKTLVGTWKGNADMGQGPIEMTVQYKLLAAGTVLEERVFQGTPNEMVTMYYQQGGKLALTHYCVMGNRPGMLLKTSDPKSITFDFDSTCGIDATKESHMHGLTITFDNPDTITTSCRAFMAGKEVESHATTLKRVSS
jgi:hypothetical protein